MEKNSGMMVEMGNHPPLKRPRQEMEMEMEKKMNCSVDGALVSNQSGASSETPVAPKNLRKGTDWAGQFVKLITSASDSDEVRTLAARGLLFFEAYLRPGVMSEIRKILRQEERCGGGYAKPISSGASSETPRSPKNLSDDAGWVDLIVKEITSASDSDHARIRATKALESFKASLHTFLMSEMRQNLQQASGYARSDLLGLDESSADDENDMPYESSPMVSNQSGASSETPVAPKNLRKGTDWAGQFVKLITSASDSDEVRTLAARGLLFFEAYLRPGVMSEIRKILRQEMCGGGYAKPISSGASSETPRSLKNLSDDAVWVDLIVKEITSASDSDNARICVTKPLESFKSSLRTFLMSEMRQNLQQASGYARSDLLGLDESSADDENDMPYESSPMVSNQSGASSETPVAPKNLRKGTEWPGIFVKAITSASDSDEVRILAARCLLFFEAYLRPGVMSEIRKILRQEERCGGGYAKPISSGASSETPRSPKNLSDEAGWVDLIVKEITSASDSDDARIRATKALESFKASLRAFLMSEMRQNLQQASGYARSDLLGLDESSADDENDMPYESSPKMEMEMEMEMENEDRRSEFN